MAESRVFPTVWINPLSYCITPLSYAITNSIVNLRFDKECYFYVLVFHVFSLVPLVELGIGWKHSLGKLVFPCTSIFCSPKRPLVVLWLWYSNTENVFYFLNKSSPFGFVVSRMEILSDSSSVASSCSQKQNRYIFYRGIECVIQVFWWYLYEDQKKPVYFISSRKTQEIVTDDDFTVLSLQYLLLLR